MDLDCIKSAIKHCTGYYIIPAILLNKQKNTPNKSL